ncbi:MAG: serine hydrolase [Planctomycetota bacterium]|jgi:hypothetical protein
MAITQIRRQSQPGIRLEAVIRPIVWVALGASMVASPARGDLTADVAQLVADKVAGGETGFLLRQINGPVLASDQPGHLFYPASSIKVLQHVHAMLEVEAGNIALNNVIQVYDDPGESCQDDHSGHSPSLRLVENVLRRMMEQSDNQDTNAIQELFGRPAINATGHGILGMSDDTWLHHKLGCDGPDSDPPNTMTLADATLLYENVAIGAVFADDQNRQDFYQLMLNGNWFSDLMEEERPDGMSNDDFDDFKAGVSMARKGGNIGSSYISTAGWIKLPSHPCSTLPPREYVFGVFFNAISDISPDFGVKDVAEAMLRGEIRAALEDWQACESCGAEGAGPCNVPHGDAGCENSDCCQTVCAIDPLCCDPDFGWDAACTSYASALCDLAPDNDDCASVHTPIIGNCDTKFFDVTDLTSDGPSHLPECNWDGPFTKDVWYRYTALHTGIVSLSVCSHDEAGDPADPFDLWVGVYDTDCSCGPELSTALIGCTFGTAACGIGGTTLQVGVTQGQCYLIRVASGQPSVGTGELSIDCVEPGDSHADPVSLGGFEGLLSFDTTAATTDGPAHATCVSAGDDQIHNDLWYAWIAPCTGTLDVETCAAADLDTKLAIYDQCTAGPSDTSLIGCNDDAVGCAGFGSRLSVPVAAGQCYLIRIGGYNGGAGTGDLSITCNETCSADFDGDGSVSTPDLLQLLAAWGPCVGCIEDLDNSGSVDTSDLLALLAAWGPC